jgi:hypothetical protein
MTPGDLGKCVDAIDGHIGSGKLSAEGKKTGQN